MRTSRTDPASRGEQGSAAVVIAIAMAALMGFTALAVDGGRLYSARRGVQNAADHAALAAAKAACTGGDPDAAGRASAGRNGFGPGNSTIAINSIGDDQYEAVVETSEASSFAGAIGRGELAAGARAVAKCIVGGGGNFAIFAGSTTCPKTLDWSGSTTHVTGRVHSNNEILVGGSNNSVTGGTTHAGSFSSTGGGNRFTPPASSSAVQPWPVEFRVQDYAPGGARATLAGSSYYNAGSAKIDKGWLEARGLYGPANRLRTGLYYTSGDVDLSDGSINGTVTFVTPSGTIKISGSNHDLEPWDPDGLLAFSNTDRGCGDFGIAMSGSNSSWAGILYAPRAMVEMSGSTNTTFRGSIISDTVKLNGSVLTVSNDEDFGGGFPQISLKE